MAVFPDRHGRTAEMVVPAPSFAFPRVQVFAP